MRKEILINSSPREVRVALLEGGELVQLFLERQSQRSIVGNVYLAQVTKVLPGMQSAFVDIGLARDAFLYVTDIAGSPEEIDKIARIDDQEEDSESADNGDSRKGTSRIEDLLREGQDILVQVVKDPLANKGARITSYVSLPGRYLVLMPSVDHIGVSRKIARSSDRDRLRKIVSHLRRPGEGIIVRTAGAEKRQEELERDVAYLQGIWDTIRRTMETARAPSLLHSELDVSLRILRDLFGPEFQRVLVDREDAFRRCRDFVAQFQPQMARRVRFYDEEVPLFEEFSIESELQKALRNRVWLRSGGSIVIHQTEALVAIDVNTGKFVGKRRLEETVLKTNLEAAREIVRQLRLRDLGGIIVVDFIDMEEESSKRELIRTLEKELQRDRSKTRLLQISDFGLVEITRQRTKRSLERTLCQTCPYCSGTGRVRSALTVGLEVEREIQKRAPAGSDRSLVVRVHPEVAAVLEAEGEEMVSGTSRLDGISFRIDADASLHREQFDIKQKR
ncbi:MAG: Rne/Rng family ribonuclease [Acidobacteriota bacterium]